MTNKLSKVIDFLLGTGVISSKSYAFDGNEIKVWEITEIPKPADVVAFVNTYEAQADVWIAAKAQARAMVTFTFPVAVLSQTLGGTSYDSNLDALVSEAVKLGANVSTDPTTGNVVVPLFVSFYNQLPAAAKALVDPYKL